MSSASEYKYQYYSNKNELAANRDLLFQLPRTDPVWQRLSNRTQLLLRCNQDYNRQYRRITGKPIENIINLPEVIIPVPTAGLKVETTLENKHEKLTQSLWLFKANLDSLQHQVNSFSGGFINMFTATYWQEPTLIKLSYARPVEKFLRKANSALKSKDYDTAAALLIRANYSLEFGLTRLENFRKTMNISGQRAIIAIKLAKEASVMALTGRANLKLGVGGTGGMSSYEKAIEDITTLGARTLWGGEKIDYSEEAKKIVYNVVAAGAGAAAGKHVSGVNGLAVDLGKKQFSKQFALQLSKKIGIEILEGQVSKATENTIIFMAKASSGTLKKKDVAQIFADQLYQVTKVDSVPGAKQVSTIAEEDIKAHIVNVILK